MKLVLSGIKRLLWQCLKKNCCGRSKRTLRSNSFFYHLKAPVNKVAMVIYLFLMKCKQVQIEKMTKLNRKTIEDIITNIYDVMEADLIEEDIQIGKINWK